jgi:hypothetical protein
MPFNRTQKNLGFKKFTFKIETIQDSGLTLFLTHNAAFAILAAQKSNFLSFII